ncbi:MAG TPA: integrase, partial [Burkholderiaceae bacterium]
PFHGVPLKLMMDPGSANTSGAFKNLLRRLSVEALVHMPEQPRGTGQVENAHNLIETQFESGLRFKAITSLADLNQAAGIWMRWFNGTKTHGRHGHTRYAMWQTIREEQLRIAPSAELCYELLTHEPQRRKVGVKLRVEFCGKEWDVSQVPNIMVGEPVMVTYNPYNAATVFLVDRDADGNEVLHAAPLIERDDAGFSVDAVVIGEQFRAHADTRADINRKQQQKLVTGTDTLEAAAAARKAKALPFGGRLDPYKHMPEETVASYLPRKGTELPSATRVAAVDRILTLFEAAGELVRRGLEMNAERNAQVRSWYPDGVPESEMDQLQQRLTVRASLRVVGKE